MPHFDLHAQRLAWGVREFAELLRSTGNRITVPDLYDGRTFDSEGHVVAARGEPCETRRMVLAHLPGPLNAGVGAVAEASLGAARG